MTANKGAHPEQPKVALVIGSGGLKCAAAIGIIQVLEENGIGIDLVVGCSGGAVFGAAIALGFSAEQMDETRTQTWTPEVTGQLDYRSLSRMLLPGLFGFNDEIGIFKDDSLRRSLETGFGATTQFSDTQIPFFCMATDLDTGEPVLISDGNLAEGIRISSSIPIIFKPVNRDGRLLIDGGISNPLPIDVAIQQGASLILAVGFETPLLPDVSSPGRFALQMFNILVNQLLYKKFAFYNLVHHSEIIGLMPEFTEEVKISDVDKVPMIVEQGRLEAQKHIDYLKQVLSIHKEPGTP
jgi:NTE family protein